MIEPKHLKMAYWIMCRAIERDPSSPWAKEATDQWIRYCDLFEESGNSVKKVEQ